MRSAKQKTLEKKRQSSALTLRRKFATPPIVGAHILQLKAHHAIRLRDVHHVIDAAEQRLPFPLHNKNGSGGHLKYPI